MLSRLIETASWHLNLKRYYAYYSAVFFLDGVLTALAVLLLWLYVPMARFIFSAFYRWLLDTSVYVGVDYLGAHPGAMQEACQTVYQYMDVERVGNTFITVLVLGLLARSCLAYGIYRRGLVEANEKI
jgi:hypothetical protein